MFHARLARGARSDQTRARVSITEDAAGLRSVTARYRTAGLRARARATEKSGCTHFSARAKLHQGKFLLSEMSSGEIRTFRPLQQQQPRARRSAVQRPAPEERPYLLRSRVSRLRVSPPDRRVQLTGPCASLTLSAIPLSARRQVGDTETRDCRSRVSK